jgi:NOL1/NOP2/fmu family ribosome biogenesis protein
MQNLKALNSKEIKKIYENLNDTFGFSKELDYAFLLNNRNRIFLINREISAIDTTKLRINSIGLYFAELPHDEVRLSIEGAQLIGKDCTKNVVELNEKEARDWLKGFDLFKETKEKSFVILKHKDDFLGCGKATGEKILNFVPKNRRLKVSD